MQNHTQHKFHIPVMGLAYTIDTPIKVARYGISSAISIVEDKLVEMMRKHYYPTIGLEYHPITDKEENYRARRITDYLNLVERIVQSQFDRLRNTAFETGTEIVKYFELLPEDSALKKLYRQMTETADQTEKEKIQAWLRSQITPGNIDVNIMTKVDGDRYNKDGQLQNDGSDAITALEGYAKSDLTNSSVIFSAGLNPRLYNYLGNCKEFYVDEDGGFAKKVIVKVSDYRSALIQGKYLAKKGIWVSEFRIESGLNCGGHAFATEGYLLGPILEEFKSNKQELVDSIFEIYNAAQEKYSNKKFVYPPAMKFTVQGGIGTHKEDKFLREYYNFEGTGWGTPFLLVPEATTVDHKTLELLSDAKEEDVVLSRNSPLGVTFHYLKGTTAEAEKLLRINEGTPGSPCTEKHLAFNTEFTKEPICTASKKYQKLKIEQLRSLELPEPEYNRQLTEVLDKECLCVGLSNSAAINYGQTFVKKLEAVTICPGPNIANFSNIVSLQTMTDHIYGRTDILTNTNRPHMFIAELHLYLKYLKEQFVEDIRTNQFSKKIKYYTSFIQNLKEGIKYYYDLKSLPGRCNYQFEKALYRAEKELDSIKI